MQEADLRYMHVDICSHLHLHSQKSVEDLEKVMQTRCSELASSLNAAKEIASATDHAVCCMCLCMYDTN